MIKNSNCIVLNTRKFSESSKIISVYSRDLGKLTFMAKGAFSNKSKFLGILETTYLIDAEFYFKTNREMHTLSNADILYRYKNLKKDFRSLTCAIICCELVNKTQTIGETNEELYDSFHKTLLSIDEGNSLIHTLNFLIEVISYLGYQISIDENFNRNGKIVINLNNGKINNYYGFSIFENEFKIISDILNNEEVKEEISLNEFNKIYNLMIRYLTIHLEKQININSLELLV